jgi:hypothetical protein
MTRRKRNCALAALCLLAVSCASQAAPSVAPTETPALFVPTHRLGTQGGLPGAVLEGILVERDGCLAIETREGQRFLALWPDGYRVAVGSGTINVLRVVGRSVATVGRPITASGGEYGRDQEALVRSLIGRAIPDACRRDRYWLVGEVEAEG